jgi:hypothetical protein
MVSKKEVVEEEIKAEVKMPEGLDEKLLQIRREVGYIQKDAKNDFQKYKYVSASNVQEKLRDELDKYGVATTVNVSLISETQKQNAKGGTETHVIVQVAMEFCDVDTLERKTVHALGSGQDNGDKSVMKATTAAIKYALMTTFMVSTGDDPEADKGVDERMTPVEDVDKKITPAQAKEMMEKAGSDIGICKQVMAEFGYKKSIDIKLSDYQQILDRVVEVKGQKED